MMQSSIVRAWTYVLVGVVAATLVLWWFGPDSVWARNIVEYRDTLSDSAPAQPSNHTLSFRVLTPIAPGGYIEVTMPPGFETLGTSTFAVERNVQLFVNGVPRAAGAVQTGTRDRVEIFSGTPGMIRYTLNTISGISSGSRLELRIGNNTTLANEFSEEFSTSTGTTTTEADIEPIVNATSLGTHKVDVKIYSGGLVADAGFSIVVIEQVGVGPVDTTEEIPPFRFNGRPTSTVSGVTANVEISLETNELAVCRYSRTANVPFNAMTETFGNTGQIFHSQIVAVQPESLQTFYIRCIDDEDNFNIDDFIILFQVDAFPTGTANTEGETSGDGTGSGNDGTGDGSGSGGTTGDSSGEQPLAGGSSGTGGSGGGGGGGSGGSSGGGGGGGFEDALAPYPSGDGQVTISGYAPAGSEIVGLVDGDIALRGRANNAGVYSITYERIGRGVYTFGVYAIDQSNTRSSTFSTSFTVTGSRSTTLSNINITPTVRVSPDPVNPGTTVTFSGYAIPNATVTVENERDGSAASRQSLTTTSGSNGAWSLPLQTNGFTTGTYKVRVKAEQEGGVETNFSNYVLYGVGQAADRGINADLNRDGRVNLVDFSILLFWWNSAGGDSDPPADINGDGRVNLVDFSILLFNWTG